ncbi:MAG: hypothetical protein LIR50_07205 [Bacillota bacterium]|nr:hypothetical protein [Bacillota bacterium]
MNIINVKVDFTKRTCNIKGVNLTEGDYNSTKMVFEFDRDDGTKILEMNNPEGLLVYLGEIIDNEVILVGKADVTTVHEDVTYIKYLDSSDNVYWYDAETEKLYDNSWQEIVSFNLEDYIKQTKDASLFNESGNFIFEISLYDGDSKLTSASGKLKVLPEQVSIDGELVEAYLPIFDELMTDITEAINKTNNLNVTASKSGTTTTITVTDKNGVSSTTQVLDGDKGDAATISVGSTTTGDPGTSASVTNSGTSSNAVFNFTIPKGDKGDTGEDGTDGVDGYSPTASVTKSGSTAIISITDKNGTTTASISDGTNGTNGTDGEDGYSPTATVTKTGKIATITITDKNGTTTTQISDGADGTGSGDMSKATYDTNDNGIVDNAEKVNNHTVETDVPVNAVFTDTTYGNATQTTAGLMSSSDKTKLDNLSKLNQGENISIQAEVELGGNTEQDGTPTPSSPVDINVVTGNNTITLSDSDNTKSISYPINLGIIELCKIGTYQDEIYKSSNKWYLHKEIGKIVSYNGETITTDYISTTGGLDTGATIYYVLTASTTTEIPDATLINQLDVLAEGLSNKWVENITQINADLGFEVTYDNNELTISSDVDLSSKQDIIQYSIMPTAGVDNLGKIIQYIGATASPYIQGHFYVAVTDGAVTPTYSWQEISFGGNCNIELVDLNNTTKSTNLYTWGVGYYKIINTGQWGKPVFLKNGVMVTIENGQNVIFLVNRIVNSCMFGMFINLNKIYILNYVSKITGNGSAEIIAKYRNDGDSWSNNADGFLSTKNTNSYIPTANYHPATKLSSETVPLTLSGLYAYSSSSTYSEGDYVYKSSTDLTIYKCNTTISTAEAWNSAHWTQKTYMDYLSDKLIGTALGGSY